MSRDEGALSPTYLAMQRRHAWSDEHMFEATDLSRKCDRCGKRRSHSDHCTPEEDRNAVMRWRDAIVGAGA